MCRNAFEMPTEHDALESKRRYVESLTRSAITDNLSLEGLEVLEQLQQRTNTQAQDTPIGLQIHLHVTLPVTDDPAVYDRIFASLKRHFV
jgi:hypothetical protein